MGPLPGDQTTTFGSVFGITPWLASPAARDLNAALRRRMLTLQQAFLEQVVGVISPRLHQQPLDSAFMR